jgi:hypothetical protein
MSFWLYFLGLMSVALLSSGLTFLYCARKDRPYGPEHWWVRPPRLPHQWYWWVGSDPQLKKEYLVAAVGKDASEAQMKLGPRNFALCMSARAQGSHDPGKAGRHVLIARSLSEINVEGN